MATFFISDLHLSGERPETIRLFIHFLQNDAAEASALYILGDLFEVWLGDDMVLPDYQPAIEAIKSLADSGIPVYVMQGNRDFLLGEQFAQMSGAQLIHDPLVIDLYGTDTLLMHGDTLCTDDIRYQEFRSMVRDPEWQANFLALSPQERLEQARHYREVSKAETGSKSEEIMDVNSDAVDHAFRENEVTQLIHGHTHRPGIHFLTINTRSCKRIVLGDWEETGSVLIVSENGYSLDRVEPG